MPTNPITADDLREHVEHWVVAKRAHSTQIVHLPAADSTPSVPQPACEHREHPTRGDSWSGWNVKSPSTYPPGYVSLCQDCARYATPDDAIPDGTITHAGDPPLKDT